MHIIYTKTLNKQIYKYIQTTNLKSFASINNMLDAYVKEDILVKLLDSLILRDKINKEKKASLKN